MSGCAVPGQQPRSAPGEVPTDALASLASVAAPGSSAARRAPAPSRPCGAGPSTDRAQEDPTRPAPSAALLPPDKAPPRDDDWDWDGDGWDPAASLTARELAELAALDRAGDSAEDWDDDIADAAPVNMAEWLTGRWVPDEELSPRPGGLPAEALPGLMPRGLGAGGGFDVGGVANRLPPGPVLAGLAADKGAAGLDHATDDELAGLMIAWRRITSWAAAGEFAAVAELSRRRQAQAAADAHLAEHVGDEIAMVLTLTSWAAGTLVDRAEGLARLPRTRAALAAGQIDVSKALVILGELTGLDGVHAARVEAAVIGRAEGWTTGELRRAVRRQVIAADPDAARRRKERAAKQARVERWAEDAGTAALAGRDLPPARVLAADAHLSAWATRLKAAGLAGNLDRLRAQVYLALLNGQPPETLLPTGTPVESEPADGQRDGTGAAANGPTSTTSQQDRTDATAEGGLAGRGGSRDCVRARGRPGANSVDDEAAPTLAEALHLPPAELAPGMPPPAQELSVMADQPGSASASALVYIEFANELRRLMDERGLGTRALARRIHYHASYVSHLRSGKKKPSRKAAKLVDQALGAEGRLAALLPVAPDRRADQDSLNSVGHQAGKEELLLADHLRRTFLAHGLAAMTLPAVNLDGLRHFAAALENASRYADANIVTYCLEQLSDCTANDGKHGPVATLPTVLGLIAVIEKVAAKANPDVRRELLKLGAKAAEFAGWLYRDAARPELANYWRDRAVEWAQVSGDVAMQGYVLLKKSQAAWDERDALRMLTLAEAVQDGPWELPARVRAEAAQQEARGRAMLNGSIGLVERKIEDARELLAQDTSHIGPREQELAAHYDNALLGVQVAICYCEAQRPVRAIELYEQWLSADTFSKRDFGYFLTLKGEAYASAGRPDEASHAGIEALSLARETGSARTLQELTRLTLQLRKWDTRDSVRSLRAAVLI